MKSIPIRLEVMKLGKNDCMNEVQKLFPHVDIKIIENFYNQVKKFREVIIDVTTGEILLACSNMGWIVTPFLIKQIPNSKDIKDADLEMLKNEILIEDNIDDNQQSPYESHQQRQNQFDLEKVDSLLGKLSDVGLDNMLSHEMNYLKQYSEYLNKK